MFEFITKYFRKSAATQTVDELIAVIEQKLQQGNLIIRAQQNALVLMQNKLEELNREAHDVVAAIVVKLGGEFILEHTFLDTVRDQKLVLRVAKGDEANTIKYSILPDTNEEQQEPQTCNDDCECECQQEGQTN